MDDCGLNFFHDDVGETIIDGFLGVEIEVAVGILLDFFQRLPGGLGEDAVQFFPQFFHFFGLDVDVHGGGPHATRDEGLVNEDARVWVEEAFSL